MRAPWALALLVALADGLWGLQALAQRPHTENSVVALASLAVWVFLHLPAAMIGGALLKALGCFNGGLDGFSTVARWTLACLGSLQVLLLVRGLIAWAFRRRA